MVEDKILKDYYDANEGYVNRFIVFYTLRCLWKLYKNKVKELYPTLFASGRIENGKTAFENIMRAGNSIDDHIVERLEETVGIGARFFSGDMKLSIPGMDIQQWTEFVYLWNLKETRDERYYRKLRRQIADKIKEASASEEQGENFNRLLFFAQNGCKKSENDIFNRLAEMEKMMSGIKKQEILRMLDDKRLREHRDLVQKYLHRINAVCMLKEWE